jgi:hypothetical protein
VQFKQLVADSNGEKEPLTHKRQAADEGAKAIVENVPTVQLRQVAALEAPTIVEYFPEEQPLQFVVAIDEKEPALQLRHAAESPAPETIA